MPSTHLITVAACTLSLSFFGSTFGSGEVQADRADVQEAPAKAAEQKHPTAAPADVESIDAITKALYDVISGDVGEERDWDRFRSLFHPELGRLVPMSPARDGSGVRARGLAPVDYVEGAKEWTMRTAFFEREVARRQEHFGSIAHLWSTYAAFGAPDADAPFMRGVNSIQLMQDGKRWWILSVIWDAESKDQPLPEKYLKSPATGK